MEIFSSVSCAILIVQLLDVAVGEVGPYPVPGEGHPLPDNKPGDATCDKAVDVAFVVDSSRSIYVDDFKLQREFIHAIVDLFEVGPDKARFSAVSFSHQLFPGFFLNSFSTKEEVLEAVDNIAYSKGGATRTYLALQNMREVLFDPRNGARPGVPHIAVVFTDGGTNPGGYDTLSGSEGKQQTITEANLAKADGTLIFAIGIGPGIDKNELKAIASSPAERFMKLKPSFSEMNEVEFRNFIAYHICKGEPSTPAPVITPAPPAPTQPKEDPHETCQGKPADIYFVLDESSSLKSQANFDKALTFVNEVIDFFQVGQGATESRIGMIGFSNGAHVEFGLNQYTSKDDVKAAVTGVRWKGGNTFTDKALKLVKNSFAPGNGARGNVAQIAIIITDGRSTNPWRTKEEAQLVQEQGIYSFAIGVGDEVYDPELDILASDPNHLYKFKVDNLAALTTIKELLAYTVCKEKKKNETAEKICGQKQADIVFIADASTSIGERDFEKQREFIYEVVHKFDIGPDATQVGLITFSNRSHVQFDLSENPDKQALHKAIKQVHWTGGLTFTADAIHMMMEHSFKPEFGARPNIPKVGIVITDGWSREPGKTVAYADQAQKMGITMFSIGVGRNIEVDELDAIATDPDDYHSFMVDDFSALASISDALAIKACDVEASRASQGKPRTRLRELISELRDLY